MEDTQFMTTSSRTYSNIIHGSSDATQNNETIDDGDSPALKSFYFRQTHTHNKHIGETELNLLQKLNEFE